MKSKVASSSRIEAYLKFAELRPDLFATPPGGVRILLDPLDIAEVEALVASRLRVQGLGPELATVGMVFDDPWIYVLRDAVEFPDGSRRTHARVVNKGGNGAAVIPVLDGEIILIRHFRHAVRRSLLEIPRGAIEAGQTPEDAARAETLEEIGGQIRKLVPLGFLHGSTNLYGSGAHLFFAELGSIGTPQLAEGITAIEKFSPTAFETKLLSGEILDGFTVAAYAHAKLRGLI